MRPIRKPNPKLPSEQPPPQHLTEPESHDPGQEILGWPGYRTQPYHSGLDPLESYNELGHILGVCLRDLLLFRVRTQNPLAWIGMAVVGFFFLAPLGTAMIYLPSMGEAALPMLIVTFLPAVLGLLLWTNLVLDVAESLRKQGSSHA